MKNRIFLWLSFVFLSCHVYGQSGKNTVFALDIKKLESTKTKISNKDPEVINAYKQLIKDADKKALAFGPVSVMEKTGLPPSGDKHDYMSLAPYHWPDPSKPDGLPYIRKDGQTNPEVKDYPDKENMPKLCENVYMLGLAYYFSEENKYAEHAAKLLKVWFLDVDTRMNPNLNYGQAIKGVNEGRGAGLIDTRHWIKLIDGIGLIKNSKYWSVADQKGMQKWFAEFLNWMQTSNNGTDEMKTKNNHGAWYDAQRLSLALFIDSSELAKKIVLNAANRLDLQMDNDGLFPAEMERTISLHYTAFVMNAFFTIAHMAEKTGFDFWKYTSPSGKSLKKAFDKMKPYFIGDKEWEGQQIKEFDKEDAYSILIDANEHFKCKDCVQAVKKMADDKAPRLRINLLY
ncbi:MAG: alginate lyase family protein [Chitinophagaceae bacterium]|nr:alginate lyase family protein [Chitinophagaceae bacterium]MBP7315990.1 alginate lyase family protein [Chitinophagaceae bacterium]